MQCHFDEMTMETPVENRVNPRAQTVTAKRRWRRFVVTEVTNLTLAFFLFFRSLFAALVSPSFRSLLLLLL